MYIWPIPSYHEMPKYWGQCPVEPLLYQLEATKQPAIVREEIITAEPNGACSFVGECNMKK